PNQSGWLQPEYYFAHSKQNLDINGHDFEIIQWLPANEAQISQAKPQPKAKKIKISSALIHDKMSPLTDYSRESFRAWCKETFNLGTNSSDDFRALMIQNGLIEVIEGEGKGVARCRIFRKIQ